MKKFIEVLALMAATILLLVFMGLISGCAPQPRNQQQICEDFAGERDFLFSVGTLSEQGYRVSCDLRPEPKTPGTPKENA